MKPITIDLRPKKAGAIPPEEYKEVTDADVRMMFSCWDEAPSAKILEIGSHDESAAAARLLARKGYDVTGIDLRTPDDPEAGKTYQYLRQDFCDPPSAFLRSRAGYFDAAYSISAIEHFGLGTYGEGIAQPLYDVIACRMVWYLLRDGGTFYLTVPYRRDYQEVWPHWRMYNEESVMIRLVQDFTLETRRFFFSAEGELLGIKHYLGDEVTEAMAGQYVDDRPHLTVFLRMRKTRKIRLAPDGR